jgi:hypothetical protein
MLSITRYAHVQLICSGRARGVAARASCSYIYKISNCARLDVQAGYLINKLRVRYKDMLHDQNASRFSLLSRVVNAFRPAY